MSPFPSHLIPPHLAQELAIAQKASGLACEIQLRYKGHLKHIKRKSDLSFVSEADAESEDAIRSTIVAAFPEDTFLGEESGLTEGRAHELGKGRRWIVDPLDGTTNYVRGMPFFSTSLALEKDGEIILGYIEAPVLKQTFVSFKNGGTFLNGVRIHVSGIDQLDDAFLATGISYHTDEMLKETVVILEGLVKIAAGVRRAGAAALDLCMVASGVFDGYWEKGLKPWDMAAGILMVSEAGGKVSQFSGAPVQVSKSDVVASNGLIHSDLVKEISARSSKT